MIKKEWVIAPFPKSTVWEVLQGQTAVCHVAPWMLSTELSLVQVALSELTGPYLCSSGINKFASAFNVTLGS